MYNTAIPKIGRKQSFNVSCTVSGTQYTLYTCPANCRAEVSMMMIVNADGNTSVTVLWYDASSGHSVHILGGKNMSTGDYVLLTGATLILEAGDKFYVTQTGGTHIDALCTVEETFIPVG